jgi:hypothetical protein
MLVLGAHPPAVSAADVHGDDERDRYVGTGGLLLPGSIDAGTRSTVAACGTCQWRLSTPCLLSPLGHAFDGQSPCMSVVRGCAAGDQLLRAWFRDGVDPWREIGLVCIGPAGPRTVSDVGRAAAGRFEQDLPDLAPTAQPERGVVAQVPVVFGSGQGSGGTQYRYQVLGTDVVLTAAPRWRWDFGDGAGLHTDLPGGRFPLANVAHPYRRAGEYRVGVTTTWSATFTVAGLGPFPVDEMITQNRWMTVRVGEGRAVLTP